MTKTPAPRAPRARRPAEEQEARGNPGKRAAPVAGTEVAPVASVLPPAYLSAGGRAVWDELAPSLIALKLLRQSDSAGFAILCDTIAEAREAKTYLEAEGYTYETQSEHSPRMIRINPRYLILDRARRFLAQYGGQFGLTPAARLTILTQLANNPNAAGALAGAAASQGSGNGATDDATASLFDDTGDVISLKGPIGLLSN